MNHIAAVPASGGVPPTPAFLYPSGSKRFLSKTEIAAYLGVSRRTIENFCAQKKIPYLRLSARMLRFDAQRVESALASYEIKAVGGRRSK